MERELQPAVKKTNFLTKGSGRTLQLIEAGALKGSASVFSIFALILISIIEGYKYPPLGHLGQASNFRNCLGSLFTLVDF